MTHRPLPRWSDMALLPANPAAVLNRADKALANVDGVLGRVDGTLGSVDTTLGTVDVTLAETRQALAEVKDLLGELQAEMELLHQLPLVAEQVAQIHAAVVKNA